MNSPIPLPLVDGALFIDNSSMELLVTCPRQAYYHYIRKLELNKSKIALDFGKAFHDTLEHLYKVHGTGYRNATQNQEVLTHCQNLVLETPEDDYRTKSYLLQGVGKYLSDYPAESFTLATTPSGAVGIEVPFARPLGVIKSPIFGEITIIWTGKIDLIYRQPGRLGIMDHKTTSMMGPQFFAEFDISHQFYGYADATEFILGEPVTEVCINGLGCRKPTRTGVQFEFARHIIPISRSLLTEWKQDCLSAITTFIRYAEDGYFPKYTKWCINKYGPCQYRGVCTLAPEHRESALSTSEFRPVTWSPLA